MRGSAEGEGGWRGPRKAEAGADAAARTARQIRLYHRSFRAARKCQNGSASRRGMALVGAPIYKREIKPATSGRRPRARSTRGRRFYSSRKSGRRGSARPSRSSQQCPIVIRSLSEARRCARVLRVHSGSSSGLCGARSDNPQRQPWKLRGRDLFSSLRSLVRCTESSGRGSGREFGRGASAKSREKENNGAFALRNGEESEKKDRVKR